MKAKGNTMKMYIHLETDTERETNLSVADAIIEFCGSNHTANLNPKTIAKAILLAVESEESDDDLCR